jgi:histone H1/5
MDDAAPVEVVEAVTVAEPVAEKAPRKRSRTRKAASAKSESAKTGAPSNRGSVKLAPGSLADADARRAAAAPKAEAAPAPVATEATGNDGEEPGAGPIANPRRTRVRSTRTRKSAAAKADEKADSGEETPSTGQ